jgi:hypothetical protein
MCPQGRKPIKLDAAAVKVIEKLSKHGVTFEAARDVF